MSHTPGPWRVNGGKAAVFMWDIVGPKGEDIGYANQSDGADEPTMYPVEANARLIAAAPELLEALKEAVEIVHIFHDLSGGGDAAWALYRDHSPEMKRITAAIAKAEGRGDPA